jgi:hypothetical protein
MTPKSPKEISIIVRKGVEMLSGYGKKMIHDLVSKHLQEQQRKLRDRQKKIAKAETYLNDCDAAVADWSNEQLELENAIATLLEDGSDSVTLEAKSARHKQVLHQLTQYYKDLHKYRWRKDLQKTGLFELAAMEEAFADMRESDHGRNSDSEEEEDDDSE